MLLWETEEPEHHLAMRPTRVVRAIELPLAATGDVEQVVELVIEVADRLPTVSDEREDDWPIAGRK
jgi:small-conductance mechanosensitive channel